MKPPLWVVTVQDDPKIYGPFERTEAVKLKKEVQKKTGLEVTLQNLTTEYRID